MIYISTANLPFPSVCGSLLKCEMPRGSCIINYLTLIDYLINSRNYVYCPYLMVANITELLSGQEIPHFLDDKLKIFPQSISN